MNRELLDQLRIISPEEQELLEGRKEIDSSIYMHRSSREIDSQLLLEEGKLISVRPHTRFAYFPKHTHNYIEMVYMCHGTTRHRINGQEIVLNKGELLILGQQATQEILPAQIDDIAVNFIILPNFFDTTLQMIDDRENIIRDFLIDCLKGKSGCTSYLHFEVSEILPIQNLVENLIWTLVNHQINKRSINQYTMGLLFLHLLNHTDRLRTDPQCDNQQIMLQVLRYIEEHYRDGQLNYIANELHYDPSWLSREIKRKSGKSFTELMQVKRLNQALFLLKTTRMKISEISESVGYDNFSYFHRIFQRYFGTSPKKYRSCI
ncbi:MAG: AraC family transcriptional regulator [Clostridia bacterium]|nr:AraC family transcriptional regulator [Clostridia bacterium]